MSTSGNFGEGSALEPTSRGMNIALWIIQGLLAVYRHHDRCNHGIGVHRPLPLVTGLLSAFVAYSRR
jgi:hypothetical protein